MNTIFDRTAEQTPRCMFGEVGFCCKTCFMGPCRITPSKGVSRTICGSSVDQIVLRNLVRNLAAGASAHIGHTKRLLGFARERKRLNRRKANEFKKIFGRKKLSSALKALWEELKFNGEAGYIKASSAPELFEAWQRLGVLPRNADREIVEAIHKTTTGVSSSALDLLATCLKLGVVDGFYGLVAATDLQDLCFGYPKVREVPCGLGVLDKDFVNVSLQGHIPIVAEEVLKASRNPEFRKAAREAGAKGIKLVGSTCTGHEIASRHGTPLANGFLKQESAILTGLLDALVLDVQCILPSLPEAAKDYNTVVFDTSPVGRAEGAVHLDFEKNPGECTRKILLMAIEAFKKRFKNAGQAAGEAKAPKNAGSAESAGKSFVTGWSIEELRARGLVEKIAEALKEGRLRGIVHFVGCSNPRMAEKNLSAGLAKRLLKENYLLFATGCEVLSLAREGLCNLEGAKDCGAPLEAFCMEHGLPPVLVFGSCVDNSRAFEALRELSLALGKPLKELPFHVAAMEWHSEKSLATATFFLACGLNVVSGVVPPISGSKEVTRILAEDLASITGSRVICSQDVEAVVARLDAERPPVPRPASSS